MYWSQFVGLLASILHKMYNFSTDFEIISGHYPELRIRCIPRDSAEKGYPLGPYSGVTH